MGIWRFVLGWDLVPRLRVHGPRGHTVQLYRNGVSGETEQNSTADAYYQHHGDVDLGWQVFPLVGPQALYLGPSFLVVASYYPLLGFVSTSGKIRQWNIRKRGCRFCPRRSGWSDDDGIPNVDVIFWVNPPDDDARAVSS
jgi:hypothetical protein